MSAEDPTQTQPPADREGQLIEAARQDAQGAVDMVSTTLPGGGAAVQRFPEIHNYSIISEIGRGGQGVVFKAVQQSTKRQVAVKVLLSGTLASERERRRFEREIDLIASLQHPNIVTVYDGGTTPEGHCYYAMEYVEGLRLDEYVRSAPSLQPTAGRQSLKNLLGLFDKICAAVSYAHQRGVIHRDLKPGNIRVDASGEPRILDFGLAKIVGREEEQSRLTVTGAFVGTLAYAAPEQAQGQPSLVGTGTDVYSLGVILYEMLTGHFPYPVVGTMAEVLRNIAEAEPERPSSWRQRSREAREPSGSGTASHRVDGELETIILKALAKEPDRRYPSAEQLRRDIENYLSGRPVEAKPDSALYVLRKLAMQHLYATAVLVFLLVSVIGFALISFDFYRQARKALDEKGFSDAIALQRSQDSEVLLDESRRALVHQDLKHFLDEMEDDHVAGAIRIKEEMTKNAPEYAVMSFLFDETMSIEALLAQVPPETRGLAYFAAGERNRRAGRVQEAIAAYRTCWSQTADAQLRERAERQMSKLQPTGSGAAAGESGGN